MLLHSLLLHKEELGTTCILVLRKWERLSLFPQSPLPSLFPSSSTPFDVSYAGYRQMN